MLALPLAYRIWIHFNPPEEKPAPSLAQFLEEARGERCVNLLAKPPAKWTDAEASAEPEIYNWLMEHDKDIQPWEWTHEARRKDPDGYAKGWLRIWKEQRSRCGEPAAKHRRDCKCIEEEIRILSVIHAHRTNQIAMLAAMAATNAFPCRVVLERLEKGRFWGWNKKAEAFECASAEALVSATNSVSSREREAARGESARIRALSGSLAEAKKKSSLFESLRDASAKNIRLVEDAAFQDEPLKKSLVETLKLGK